MGGLTRVAKDAGQIQDKGRKSNELTRHPLKSFKSTEPEQKHGLRASPEKEECGVNSKLLCKAPPEREDIGCNDSDQTTEPLRHEDKISSLPLADLFKSMKTAFAVKCSSHSGELRKSPPGSKKSVDFLASSLMVRAVAKSQDPPPVCDPTSSTDLAVLSPFPTPSTLDRELEQNIEPEIQPLHDTANHEAMSDPIHTEPTQAKSQIPGRAVIFSGQVEEASSEPIQTSPLPPVNSDANQRVSSGLALIGACYCSSSDEEL